MQNCFITVFVYVVLHRWQAAVPMTAHEIEAETAAILHAYQF